MTAPSLTALRQELAKALTDHNGYKYDPSTQQFSCSCGSLLEADGTGIPAGVEIVEWWLSVHRADALLPVVAQALTEAEQRGAESMRMGAYRVIQGQMETSPLLRSICYEISLITANPFDSGDTTNGEK